MLALVRNSLEILPVPTKGKLRWHVLFDDLILLFSLWVARLLVWRVLRRERKERELRRKRLNLVNGNLRTD